MEKETTSGFRVNFFDRRVDDATGEYVGGGTVFVRPDVLGAMSVDQTLIEDASPTDDTAETAPEQ